MTTTFQQIIEILRSHGSEYEDDCLLMMEAASTSVGKPLTRRYNPEDGHLQQIIVRIYNQEAFRSTIKGKCGPKSLKDENH
jgi:hypothetical protein